MEITTVGLDLAKNVFQVHGVNRHGKVELRKRKSCGSGSSSAMLSSRPRASVARSSRPCRSPVSSKGGAGGSGKGTKARTVSPPTVLLAWRPEASRRMGDRGGEA